MEKKGNILDKINNKIPDSFKDLLEIGGNLVAIIMPVGGLIGLVVSWLTGNLVTGGAWKNYAIVALALIIIVVFYRLIRLKFEHKLMIENMKNEHQLAIENLTKLYQNERSIVSQKYYQLIHDYRNIINDLEYSYKKGKLTDEQLTVMVTRFLENCLDYLVDTLSEMSGQVISGCVKAIIGGNCNRISYEDAKVNTFVRSHNTNPARRSLDQRDEKGVLLRDNTDFLDIVAEDRDKDDSVFFQPNLKKYAEQLRKIGKVYKNSTPHWDEYYIGTIVAPIRIASKRLFYLDNNSPKRRAKKSKKYSVYYTLGFLCVDSLSEEAFSWDQKENYTYMVKAYAAAMFNILSKNQFYLKRLHEKENEAKEKAKNVDQNMNQK